MKFSLLQLSALGLAGLAASSPVSKRHHDVGKLSSSPPPHGYCSAQYGSFNNFNLQVNDVNILQFALMLEIEQTLFYDQGFSQFSVSDMISVGLSEDEVIEFQNAAIIEQTHVDTIVSVLQSLGQTPFNQPEFYFNFQSPVDFVEQLAIQEYIATGAYLGAAPLVSSKDILGSAASIMCTEARQSSFTNSVLGMNGFSSAFETSLSIEQVVTLVAPFIASLPGGTVLDALGFNTQSFVLQQTSITAFQEVSIDSDLQFSYFGGNEIAPPSGMNQLYCAYSVGSNSFYTPYSSGSCPISQSLEVGNVVAVQVTVSESVDISDCLTAPQFVTIV